MGFWQATYKALTQDLETWGICDLRRKRKSMAIDLVTFKLDGQAFDTSPLPFLYKQPISFIRNGVPWFTGIVTQPKPGATGLTESIDYEISGPWYHLEHIIFQQQWAYIDTTGAAAVTTTTTISEVILGQSLDGIKMNSGEIITEVLLYAQYAYQMQPFPNKVQANHLPPPPDPSKGPLPFLIGRISLTITSPYTTVKDKSCADIIKLVMKHSPDAVAWFDYSTSPPTFNIDQRSKLAAQPGPAGANKTISVVNSQIVTEFKPDPQYKLQVPVVVAKFQQNNTKNGQNLTQITEDSYPPPPAGINLEVWRSQENAWIQTIDLVGSQTTQQSVDLTCIARPVLASDEVAMSWILYHESWLKKKTGPGAGDPYLFDWNRVDVAQIDVVIDPNDPLTRLPAAANNPFNVPLPDCHTLVNELILGSISGWIGESNQIVSAKVNVTALLSYSGNDPATSKYFTFDPRNPLLPKPPGKGYRQVTFTCNVTNADTGTYSALTSYSAAEPVPVGFAQALYEALEQLHFSGDIILTEDECSDILPPGSVFNTSDGNPDWQQMNALVLSVEEDINMGITKVSFGPPLMLGLGEMAELYRANLGRLPSFKLDQRTTGMTTAGANVQDPRHTPNTSIVSTPPVPLDPPPWQFYIDVQGDGSWLGYMLTGAVKNTQAQGDSVAVSNFNTKIALNPAGDFFYLEIPITNFAPSGPATLMGGEQGGTFDPNAAAFASANAYAAGAGSPPIQTFTRIQLAKVTADNQGRPIVVPCISQDLQLKLTNAGGNAALVLEPSSSAT